MKQREAGRERLREELRNEVREELRRELREEVRRELREEARHEEAAAQGADGHARDGAQASEPPSTAAAMGAGALGAAALLLLADQREKLRPLVVGGMKEFFRFRDWLGTQAAGVREDLSDMSAEARAAYEEELGEQLAAVEREREMLQRLKDLTKRRGGAEGH